MAGADADLVVAGRGGYACPAVCDYDYRLADRTGYRHLVLMTGVKQVLNRLACNVDGDTLGVAAVDRSRDGNHYRYPAGNRDVVEWLQRAVTGSLNSLQSDDV